MQVQPAGTDANNELLKIWIARYLPKLGEISNQVRPLIEDRLRLSVTNEARQATHHRIISHLASDCDQAATDTQRILLAAGLPPDKWEIQELNIRVYKIYETLIDYYAVSFIFSPVLEYLNTIELESGRLQAATLVIPKFESLMQVMGPLLRELKAVYFASVNRHLIGFMTTQMHFTRQHILNHLDPYEHIWLDPYLQILDELMCMPWQRICAVELTQATNPHTLPLVKKMIPKVSLISALTYHNALQTYPRHTSCQGRIQSDAVQRSSIRDLSMFQAYIWLCVLEGSTAVIERQLLPICLQVFPITNIDWGLVVFAIQTIIDMIQQQLTPSEKIFFKKYSDAIENLFLNAASQVTQENFYEFTATFSTELISQ